MKKVTYDLSQIKEMSGNDLEFIRLMVATFVKEMPIDLDHLALAIIEEDHESVFRYAHKMKPSLELFGLKGYQQVLILETWGKNEEEKDVNEDFMQLHQELEEVLIQLKRDF